MFLSDNTLTLEQLRNQEEFFKKQQKQIQKIKDNEYKRLEEDAKKWAKNNNRDITEGYRAGDDYLYDKSTGKYRYIQNLTFDQIDKNAQQTIDNEGDNIFIKAHKNQKLGGPYGDDSYLPMDKTTFANLFNGQPLINNKYKYNENLYYMDQLRAIKDSNINPFLAAPIELGIWANRNQDKILNYTPIGIIASAQTKAIDSVFGTDTQSVLKDFNINKNPLTQTINTTTNIATGSKDVFIDALEKSDVFSSLKTDFEKYKTIFLMGGSIILYSLIRK